MEMTKVEFIICPVVCGMLARCAFDNIALGGLVAAVMASFYVAVDRICKAIGKEKDL